MGPWALCSGTPWWNRARGDRRCVWRADVMRSTVGAILLGLSGSGYPLTQFVYRRWGAGGPWRNRCAPGWPSATLLMVTGGVPGRLRRVPAVLLHLELHVQQIWRRRAHSWPLPGRRWLPAASSRLPTTPCSSMTPLLAQRRLTVEEARYDRGEPIR